MKTVEEMIDIFVSFATTKFTTLDPENTGASYEIKEFIWERSRKYHRVYSVTYEGRKSIWCFVEAKTGSVLKPATYKAPAKGERYNLLCVDSRTALFTYMDKHGGCLYADRLQS